MLTVGRTARAGESRSKENRILRTAVDVMKLVLFLIDLEIARKDT